MPRLTDEQKRQNSIDRHHQTLSAMTKVNARNTVLTDFQKLRRAELAGVNYFPDYMSTRTLEHDQCICVSCMTVKSWKEMDGGHYMSRACLAVAFSRENVWPQCKYCNSKPPRGLGGNRVEYRKSLVEILGLNEVLLLESQKEIHVEFSLWHYAERRECYKDQLRLVMRSKGL